MTTTNPFEDAPLTTILVVSDPVKSKDFYVNVLGAELFRAYDTSIVLKFLGHWLLLVMPGEPTADKPETHFIAPENSAKVDHAFTIRVKSCEVSYNILKNRGAEFITPPHDWGSEIRCFFHDPDGHLFEISEYTGKA